MFATQEIGVQVEPTWFVLIQLGSNFLNTVRTKLTQHESLWIKLQGFVLNHVGSHWISLNQIESFWDHLVPILEENRESCVPENPNISQAIKHIETSTIKQLHYNIQLKMNKLWLARTSRNIFFWTTSSEYNCEQITRFEYKFSLNNTIA